MRQTPYQKTRLGLLVTLGLAAFLMVLYFIGEKRDMFTRSVHLFTVFNNANGLQAGNIVRYTGINAGTVEKVEIVNDTSVRVDMVIDESVLPFIRRDAVATIGSDGLVGSMIVNILPGRGELPPVKNGDVIGAYNRIRTEDLLKTLNVTNENAAMLTANLLKITGQITQGDGTVSMMLNDASMAQDLKASIANLKNGTASASNSLKSLENLILEWQKKDNLLGVISDTATAAQIRRTLAHLESAASAADSTLLQADLIAKNVRTGEGLLPYLLNDARSAKKVDSLLIKMNTAGKLLNEDLEALQHNVFFRAYFRKKAKKEKPKE